MVGLCESWRLGTHSESARGPRRARTLRTRDEDDLVAIPRYRPPVLSRRCEGIDASEKLTVGCGAGDRSPHRDPPEVDTNQHARTVQRRGADEHVNVTR